MVEKVHIEQNQSTADEIQYVAADYLKKFMKDVFIKLKVPTKDAEIIADVLIMSDLRGI